MIFVPCLSPVFSGWIFASPAIREGNRVSRTQSPFLELWGERAATMDYKRKRWGGGRTNHGSFPLTLILTSVLIALNLWLWIITSLTYFTILWVYQVHFNTEIHTSRSYHTCIDWPRKFSFLFLIFEPIVLTTIKEIQLRDHGVWILPYEVRLAHRVTTLSSRKEIASALPGPRSKKNQLRSKSLEYTHHVPLPLIHHESTLITINQNVWQWKLLNVVGAYGRTNMCLGVTEPCGKGSTHLAHFAPPK